MSCKQRFLAALVSASALGSAGAAPVALTADGTWFEFVVGDVGDTWRSPLDGDPITFTLTSAAAFTLRLVDVGFAGDRVEVVSGGSSVLGTTSDVAVDDFVYAITADEAFAAPGTWSQGSWLLSAGTYEFSGSAFASPFGGASWWISALAEPVTGVPEPSSVALVLGSLGLLAATRKRRMGRSPRV